MIKIILLKTIAPVLKSTERFALDVLNDPQYDKYPQYIDKEKIQNAFNEYGYKLSPYNDTFYSVGMNTPNIEGHFLAQNIPEIESTVINERCDEHNVKVFLEKDDEITHIGISTYAVRLDNAINIIRMIKQDFPDKIIYLGGIGVLYPHIQKLIDTKNICFGSGINWLRKKFDLPMLEPKDIKIPIIETFGTEFISYTTYFISQVGCPFSCNFCATGKFLDYIPFCNKKKIIQFLEKLKDSHDKDLFLYICDSNSFFPENIWKDVFKHFIDNKGKNDNLIHIISPVSLAHLKKFNIKRIQEKCSLKLFIANFGIESALEGGYEKNFGITNKFINELNSYGIITYHNFILGLPHHTEKTIDFEIERNLQFDSAMFSINTLKPIPTTSVHDLLKNKNRLFGEELPPEFLYQDGFFPFEHPNLGKGFDALELAFKAYYKSEQKSLNIFANFADNLTNSPIIDSSRKIKKIAQMFLKMSEISLPSFKVRLPSDLINPYEFKLKKIKQFFSN